MPDREIVICIILLVLGLTLLPLSIRWYIRSKKKLQTDRLAQMLDGSRKAYLLTLYLDGIDAFKRNIMVMLELLPNELIIKEHPGIIQKESDKSASLPYSRIVGVDFVQAERYGDVGIFRNIRLDNATLLVIKYHTPEGELKELFFRKTLPNNDYNLFIDSLKARIPIQHPKHTEL